MSHVFLFTEKKCQTFFISSWEEIKEAAVLRRKMAGRQQFYSFQFLSIPFIPPLLRYTKVLKMLCSTPTRRRSYVCQQGLQVLIKHIEFSEQYNRGRKWKKKTRLPAEEKEKGFLFAFNLCGYYTIWK